MSLLKSFIIDGQKVNCIYTLLTLYQDAILWYKQKQATAPLIFMLDNQRELIDRAAALLNKNRTDFILEASCREAENVLLDQRLFILDEQQFAEFDTALQQRFSDNKHIRQLLEGKAPWDE